MAPEPEPKPELGITKPSMTIPVTTSYAPKRITIRDVIKWSTQSTTLQIGETTRLTNVMSPETAHSGIQWSSSAPAVATVDEWGKVTAHGTGTATITAVTYNSKKDTYTIKVPNGLPELQYTLTADGSGYEVTGYDAGAYTAHIPASYQGLPVVAIQPGAFKDCQNLRYFTVDAAQTNFYEVGGVIFADTPDKTLVCFPPAYDVANYYYIPAGTAAVAPYAFAGMNNLRTLTLPGSLTTLGDCAFAEARRQTFVYTTDNLTEIGANLLSNQYSNVPFYGSSRETIFAQYANENNIPFGLITNDPPLLQAAEVNSPLTLHAPMPVPVSGSKIVEVEEHDHYHLSVLEGGRLERFYDLSSYQDDSVDEVRLMLESQWSELLPDKNGNTMLELPQQTGLYGMGYTDGEALLRAYDRSGLLIAMQEIGGNFSFCFPGAAVLGVEGGKNTLLSVIPVEPVYISSSGEYPVQPQKWYQLPDGNLMQFLIVQYPSAKVTLNVPSHLNLLAIGWYDATGEFHNAGTPYYQIVRVSTVDASRLEQMGTASVELDGMDMLMDTEELRCMAAGAYGITEEAAIRCNEVLQTLKQTIAGIYYPVQQNIQKITIQADGGYPNCQPNGIIQVAESDFAQFDALTVAHEMVHAVDYSIPATTDVLPSAWCEGRAEYISRKVCDRLGISYWERPMVTDWSFLSDAEKSDFFRYYYFSTNRETCYSVGYTFLRYLNETYGEDISVKIMTNAAELTDYDDHDQWNERNAALFKRCVEDATEVGVFQNFVRDVIEG